MDLDKLKKDLFYRNGKFSLSQTCCLGCIFIVILVAVLSPISDTNTNADVNKPLSAYDRIPDEFKDTDEYQILEFENSFCAVDSFYNMVLNETNEKTFTYSFDSGNLEGIYLSIKELDDDSQDINASNLKEPDYRFVESEKLNFDNTPLKRVSFTDTHGGETTNHNWVDYTVYTFDKNDKHYQITFYTYADALLDNYVEKIIESFTEKWYYIYVLIQEYNIFRILSMDCLFAVTTVFAFLMNVLILKAKRGRSYRLTDDVKVSW